MRLYCLLTCLCIASTGNALAATAEFNPVRQNPAAESEQATQRIIVKLREAETNDAVEQTAVTTLTRRTYLSLKSSRQIAGSLHVMEVQPAISGEAVADTLTRLRADPAVEYAEVDQRRYPHALPNDPLYSGQWYLQNNGATPSAINAVTAWDTTTGSSGVVIAFLDTGVRFDHPDLLRSGAGGRLLPGYDFVSNATIANDGNGREADPSDPGDWVSTSDKSNSLFNDCPVANSSWHGTRVAGILGAITNNATGMAGLTWNNGILPVRVLGKCGGYDSDIVEAMLWAGGLRVSGVANNPNPAQIVNLSLGSSGACPNSYIDAISRLKTAGVLVVVSAGNAGGPVDAPANCSGVAAVAGLRHAGTKVGYSSLGPEIALSAPAGNCVSEFGPCIYPINTAYNTSLTTPENGINSYSDQFSPNYGTSFSSPIVAGIAALMKSVNSNLNTTQLTARLKEGTTAFPVDGSIPTCHVPTSANDIQDLECNCTTQTCGAGMANAAKAVAAARRPIAVITGPSSYSPGQDLVFQGGASKAANQRTISAYSWSIINGGANPPVISGANTATATITAPASGTFTVRLTVTDDASLQDTADVVLNQGTFAGGGGGVIDLLTLLAGLLMAAARNVRRSEA